MWALEHSFEQACYYIHPLYEYLLYMYESKNFHYFIENCRNNRFPFQLHQCLHCDPPKGKYNSKDSPFLQVLQRIRQGAALTIHCNFNIKFFYETIISEELYPDPKDAPRQQNRHNHSQQSSADTEYLNSCKSDFNDWTMIKSFLKKEFSHFPSWEVVSFA